MDEDLEPRLYEPLLDAIKDGASLEAIRSILETAPEEETHGKALFALISEVITSHHGLLLAGMHTPGIVRLLLNHDPSCTRQRDWYECTLLHHACETSADIDPDLIRRLLQLYPDAARIRTKDLGNLPIHLLAAAQHCSRLESLAVTAELLLEHYPESIRTFNGDGELPLHLACHQYIDERPAPLEVVRFWVDAYPGALSTASLQLGGLPIHCACCSDGDSAEVVVVEVVDYLCSRYPEGVRARDGDGRFPLHASCFCENWDTARRLIEAYPEGARVGCNAGKLPIHHACCGFREAIPLDLVQLLIHAYPESTRVRSNLGRLALHDACCFHAPLEVLQLLLESYPGAIHATDNKGMLPLHYACTNLHCDLDHIRILVRHSDDPLTLLWKTNEGMTPLQLAYRTHSATDDAKRFLLEEQENVMLLYRDAIEFLVGVCLDFVDNNNSFPDLVVDRIFEFAKPDVWYPPDENAPS